MQLTYVIAPDSDFIWCHHCFARLLINMAFGGKWKHSYIDNVALTEGAMSVEI